MRSTYGPDKAVELKLKSCGVCIRHCSILSLNNSAPLFVIGILDESKIYASNASINPNNSLIVTSPLLPSDVMLHLQLTEQMYQH